MGRGPVIFYALTLAVSGSSVRLPRPFMRDFVVSFNLVWLIDTQDTSYINRLPGMDILRSTMQILGLLCTIQEQQLGFLRCHATEQKQRSSCRID